MAILLNRSTRVIVQGFTGKIGSFHADDMKRYGTKLVGEIALAQFHSFGPLRA